MKKYGGARTTTKKKSLFKRKNITKGYTFKNDKSKEEKFQKNLKKIVENKMNDNYSYIKVLRKFKRFFNNILKLENKLEYSNDMNVINNFDMKKMEIYENLEKLENKHGKLMSRIRDQSSDIYKKLKKEINDNNNNNNNNNLNVRMNGNNNNNNDKSTKLIELYANVIDELLDLDENYQYKENVNQKIISDLSIISITLADELTTEFLKVEKKTEIVEDELADLFKGFTI